MPRSLLRPVIALAIVGTAVVGCSSTVPLTPAPDAGDPACAAVIVRLPDSVDGQQRRWTDAQATGAWGTPTNVVLTCGITPPGPSTLPCQTVDRVDWLIDDSEAPNYRFTTFGRVPAVEVYLNYDEVSSGNVLRALATPVKFLPTTGQECTARPSREG